MLHVSLFLSSVLGTHRRCSTETAFPVWVPSERLARLVAQHALRLPISPCTAFAPLYILLACIGCRPLPIVVEVSTSAVHWCYLFLNVANTISTITTSTS